jgi:glycosyltransferase involved in cell wall biosynthesis
MATHPIISEDVPAGTEPRRLLMLAYWYPPVNESGALRPYRFCKYLGECGYQSLVVTASRDSASEPAPMVIRTPNAHGQNRSAARAAGFIRGLQRLLPYSDCLEWVPHAVTASSPLLGRGDVPVIVSTSPPVATHVAALWLKRRHRVGWIADFRDPLVGNPFRSRVHGRLYDAFLERRIMSRADAVIVNTDAALESLGSRYPGLRHKLHLIWNAYDPEDEIKPAPIPPRAYRLMAHFGSIYGGRHPGILLNSLDRLMRRGQVDPEKIRVSLVGSIDHDTPWASASAFMDLANRGCLEYTNRVLPRDEARRLMGEADYLLLLDLNEHGTGLQVPAKIFEYVRVGRPILTFTTVNSPAERLLRQSGVPHVCVYPEDANDEVDRKVLALVSLSSNPVTPSQSFADQFDARKQTRSLAEVLSSVAMSLGK